MTTQPEALRLASELTDDIPGCPGLDDLNVKAAAELRRLHEVETLYRAAMRGRHAMSDEVLKLTAQRDALLEALKRMASIIDKMGDMPDGFIHPSPWQTLKCEEALTQARAAIRAVEGEKT